MHTAEEAAAYLTQIRKLVKWIGICDGNMEEGSIRCDANVSVRPVGSTHLGTRVEVKNLNSIRHLKQAVQLEIDRLINLSLSGTSIVQETRSYDTDAGLTFSIRTKEDADDYRYFPEPDLPPFIVDDAFLTAVRNQLPALPEAKIAQYLQLEGISEYDAEQLTDEYDLSNFFDVISQKTQYPKLLVNFLLGPVRSYLNDAKLKWSELPAHPEDWEPLLKLVAENKVSFSQAAQSLLPSILTETRVDVFELAQQKSILLNTNEEDHLNWVAAVLGDMPDKVSEYKKGKKGLIGLFVGEVKKRSRGKADPKKTTELLIEKLEKI